MHAIRILSIGIALVLLLAAPGYGQKIRKGKEDQEPKTQVLEAPKELPNSLVAATANLRFYATPLSDKGLLTQQVKDGVRAVLRAARGGTIIRVRAFVAGRGDLRRVGTTISEELSDKRLSLPVLTTVQVSGLPMVGAQVQIEAVIADRKVQNPQGLAFFSGQQVVGKDALAGAQGLLDESLGNLKKAMAAAQVSSADLLAVTCYAHSLDGSAQMLSSMQAVGPQASISLLQLARATATGVTECEAVGRLSIKPAKALVALSTEGLPRSTHYSQVMLVGAERLAFTSARLGFRDEDGDVRLVFQRLGRDLGAESGLNQIAMARYYPLYSKITERVRAVKFEFFDKANMPASTLLQFDGLPGLDSAWALDLIAVAK